MSVCVWYKVKEVAPSNEMRGSPKYIFTINYQDILTMFEHQIRAGKRDDSSLARVCTDTVVGSTFLTQSFEKTCRANLSKPTTLWCQWSQGSSFSPHTPASDSRSVFSDWWFLLCPFSDLRSNHWLEFRTILSIWNWDFTYVSSILCPSCIGTLFLSICPWFWILHCLTWMHIKIDFHETWHLSFILSMAYI